MKNSLKQLAGTACAALSVVLPIVLLTLVVSFYWNPWLLEIYVSFTPQIFIVGFSVLLLVVAYLVRYKQYFRKDTYAAHTVHHWLLIAGIVAGLFCGVQVFTRNAAVQNVYGRDGTYRIAQFNKLRSNTDYEGVATYMKTQRVDILGMEETKKAELEKVAKAMGYTYTYSSDESATKPHMPVGIISKTPIKNTRIIPYGNGHGVLRAEVETSTGSGKYRAVYVLHIVPPFTPAMANESEYEFAKLAEIIQAEKLPTILMGDFNTTIYSPKLQKLADKTDSKIRSTTSNAPKCSWYGYGPIFCMRIDHVYVPSSGKIDRVRIAPDLGSDHRAVIVDYLQ